jgi:ComF family protein
MVDGWSMHAQARSAGAELETALIPWRCLCCEAPAQRGLDLCPACLAALPWDDAVDAGLARDPAPCARLLVPLRYAFPVDRLIVGLKFGGKLEHGRLLGGLLADRLSRASPPIERGLPLLPMPLHPSRLAERGFNQAAELARIVAPVLEATLAPDLARRTRPTPPQSRLDADARRANLRGAFAASQVPARIIVLDDVVTTGATVRELSATLRAAGAEQVIVLAVARAGR